jgi:hypothetical protein
MRRYPALLGFFFQQAGLSGGNQCFTLAVFPREGKQLVIFRIGAFDGELKILARFETG